MDSSGLKLKLELWNSSAQEISDIWVISDTENATSGGGMSSRNLWSRKTYPYKQYFIIAWQIISEIMHRVKKKNRKDVLIVK